MPQCTEDQHLHMDTGMAFKSSDQRDMLAILLRLADETFHITHGTLGLCTQEEEVEEGWLAEAWLSPVDRFTEWQESWVDVCKNNSLDKY